MSELLDVLIVGGGPTGMMAAATLLASGVKLRIVDQQPARSDKSRALVVHARTLELFQKLGIAEALVARGRTALKVEWYVGDRPPLEIDLGDIGAADTPYPFLLFVSQVETEAALESHLRENGVVVERPLELISFAQDERGVEAKLKRGDGTEERVRARYLIGADGAHSAVRKGAGLKFEGSPYDQNFVLADAEVEWGGPEGVLRLFMSERGVLVAFPMPGKSRYRLIAAEGTRAASPGDPSLEEAQALISKLSPLPIRIHDPHWLARFHLHHRGVDRYRAGRAFVAGDAAHIHSPAGGQGMNTGLQDAANLGWKLGMVLRGFASDSLLDSYHAERWPVGQRLLKFTDRLFSLAASRSHWVVGLRDFVLPHLVPLVTGSESRRAQVFRFISQIGIEYRGSPVVSARDRGFHGGPKPGERAPDGPIQLGGAPSTLFARLANLRHQLVVFGQPGAAKLAPLKALRPEWLDVVPIEASETLRQRYGVSGPALYLIRPDGYVAFREESHEAAPLAEFLAHVY